MFDNLFAAEYMMKLHEMELQNLLVKLGNGPQ